MQVKTPFCYENRTGNFWHPLGWRELKYSAESAVKKHAVTMRLILFQNPKIPSEDRFHCSAGAGGRMLREGSGSCNSMVGIGCGRYGNSSDIG
jgi:hypothetical protein